MELNVELCRIDPIGAVNAKWRFDKSPAEDGVAVHTHFEVRKNILESDFTTCGGRRLVKAQSPHMTVIIPLFNGQETGVSTTELFQCLSPGS
jgi:hypothetical protein